MDRNVCCLTTGSGWALAMVGRIVHRGVTISVEREWVVEIHMTLVCGEGS